MAQLMLVNPRKRRRRKTTAKRKTTTRRRRNPVGLAANPRRRRRSPVRRRRHTVRRRNPSPRMMSAKGVMKLGTEAITAAGGALALDVAWGYAPIPDNLKAGPLRHVVKAAGAIGLGVLAGMVVKKDTANQMALGALTVVAHSAMTDAVSQFAPGVKLGGYDDMDLGAWVSSGYPATGLEDQSGMGAWMNTGTSNMGAWSDSTEQYDL